MSAKGLITTIENRNGEEAHLVGHIKSAQEQGGNGNVSKSVGRIGTILLLAIIFDLLIHGFGTEGGGKIMTKKKGFRIRIEKGKLRPKPRLGIKTSEVQRDKSKYYRKAKHPKKEN